LPLQWVCRAKPLGFVQRNQEYTMNKDRPTAKNDPRSDVRNPDSSAPGSHPVGTAVGAATGGIAAGAAIGTVAGPLGTAAGAVAGAVVGALAGKEIADQIDLSAEDAYWRDNYSSRAYVDRGTSYDDYGPAYRYGVDAYPGYFGRDFDEVEPDLRRDWDSARGTSALGWHDAKHAVRDSWRRLGDRIERATPGDSDRDGR
jgi:hypothetical protein